MATRWGIVGAGKISHDFVTAVNSLPKSEHQLVAVSARDAQRAKDFAKLHNIPSAYGSYTELANDKNVGKDIHRVFMLYVYTYIVYYNSKFLGFEFACR